MIILALAIQDEAYVDAPKLLDGVKGDDFLQQIVPIVTLRAVH